MPGIPVDPEAFGELAHSFDLDGEAYYRPLVQERVDSDPDWTSDQTKLDPVALLCDESETWVTGIVAKNPHYDHLVADVTRSRKEVDPLCRLHEFEFLICRLNSWHRIDDRVDYYYLWGLQVAHTSPDVTVLEIAADWNDWVIR